MVGSQASPAMVPCLTCPLLAHVASVYDNVLVADWASLSSFHKMDEILDYGHCIINAAGGVPRGTEGTFGS